MNNNYFILRHGHSLRNVKDVANCWPEKVLMPLTKKGEAQARKSGRELRKEKIDMIFFSDLLRTKQTAEIAADILGLKAKKDKRLREINVGIFDGKPIKKLGRFWDEEGKLSPKQYYSKRYEIAPPKGENYKEVEARFKSFLKEMEKKYKGKNILIVSHQRPLTILEKVFYNHSLDKFVKMIMEKKEIKPGQWRKLK